MKEKDIESASIDSETVDKFIKTLSNWGDTLEFKDRAILQLLLSSVDRTLTKELGTGGGAILDIDSATRAGLSSLFTKSGAIFMDNNAPTSWAKIGPIWVKSISEPGSIRINPQDKIR